MAPKPILELLPDPSFLTLKDFTYAYRDMGEKPDARSRHSKAPLLLLHGFGGDMNAWYFSQGPLSRNRRVLCPDFPGHGQSDLDVGNGGPEHFANGLKALLEALEIDHAHLCGHSMGGSVALAFALRYPEHVASLCLVNPAGLGPELDLQWFQRYAEAKTAQDLFACLQPLTPNPTLITEKMIAYALEQRQRTGQSLKQLAAPSLAAQGQAYNYAPRLPDIACPALVIWGKEDPILPLHQTASLPEKFSLKVLDGIGHMPPQEDPSLFNRLLSDFLAQQDRL